MSVKVTFLPEARAELAALPDIGLQRECIRLLARAGQSIFGLSLGPHPRTGDLSSCRKIYFGEAAYRAVIRYRPDEVRPTHVVVVAVGPRENMDVYHAAAQRLLDK